MLKSPAKLNKHRFYPEYQIARNNMSNTVLCICNKFVPLSQTAPYYINKLNNSKLQQQL